MTQKILVPVDGSDVATRALAFAIERAKKQAAEITVVFVVNRLSVAIAVAAPYTYVDPTPLLETLDAEANVVLSSAESLVRNAGVGVHRAQLDGVAAPEILSYAREMAADMIVIGTHGRTGFNRFAIGSTAEDVIRAASVPVFAMPQQCRRSPEGPLQHLLVAIDGSPAAAAALALACEVSMTEGARITLCTVLEPTGVHWDDLDRDVFLRRETEEHAKALLERERAKAAAVGVKAAIVARTGDAAREILSAADDCGADALVIGTHGRAGIPRFILGSVAEAVLRASHLPVCAIRHK